MKIKKIRPYRFRNDAHFQFYDEFLALLRQYEVISQKTSVLFAIWFPFFQKEDDILKKIVKSPITAQIYEADKARDDMYTGMRLINEETSAIYNIMQEFEGRYAADVAAVGLAFSPIRDQLNVLALVEGGAIYDEFIKRFNVIIDKYVLLYRPRGGRGRGKEEEDTETEGGSDE